MKVCDGGGDGRKINWEEVAKLVDGEKEWRQCFMRWYCYLDPALDKYNREPYWTDNEVRSI